MLTIAIISIVIAVICLLVVWRLNMYIQNLEEIIDEEVIKRLDVLEDSFRTVVKEDYLKPDAKIKKPLIPNEDDI